MSGLFGSASCQRFRSIVASLAHTTFSVATSSRIVACTNPLGGPRLRNTRKLCLAHQSDCISAAAALCRCQHDPIERGCRHGNVDSSKWQQRPQRGAPKNSRGSECQHTMEPQRNDDGWKAAWEKWKRKSAKMERQRCWNISQKLYKGHVSGNGTLECDPLHHAALATAAGYAPMGASDALSKSRKNG